MNRNHWRNETEKPGAIWSEVSKGKDDVEHVELGQYLKDLFDHNYSTFILNFGGMEEMMQGIGD